MATDTILGGICEAITAATSGWKVEIGFNTDVNEWITENRSSGRTILVAFDADEPTGPPNEAGYVRKFRMSLSIYMRTKADVQTFLTEVWPVYKSVREALNGLVVNDGGARRSVTIGAGSPDIGAGFAIPALQITVQ